MVSKYASPERSAEAEVRLLRAAELKRKYNLTQRVIAARMGVAQSAVARYLKIARARGLL